MIVAGRIFPQDEVMKQEVMVVGATGMLGAQIVDALLARGEAAVSALVRQPEKKQQELAGLRARGVRVVAGDVTEPRGLAAALEGVTTVISALNNQESLIVAGQTALLEAAVAAGVRRFFPSDFSVDYRKLAPGDNYNLDMRKAFLPRLLEAKIEHTLVLNGGFHEIAAAPFVGWIDLAAGAVRVWGDGDQKMDFTGTTDTARYVAAAALDPRLANRALRIAGSEISTNEAVAMLERIRPGKFRPQTAGSVAELREAWERQRAKTPENPWSYLGSQYLWAMVSGVGKLDALDNGLYPEIQPESLESYLARTL